MLVLRKRLGFTLIELVIVIAILAILAAILSPVVIGYIQEAKDGVAVNNIDVISREFKTALILATTKGVKNVNDEGSTDGIEVIIPPLSGSGQSISTLDNYIYEIMNNSLGDMDDQDYRYFIMASVFGIYNLGDKNLSNRDLFEIVIQYYPDKNNSKVYYTYHNGKIVNQEGKEIADLGSWESKQKP